MSQFVQPRAARAVLASSPDARVEAVDEEDNATEARPGSGENAAGFLKPKTEPKPAASEGDPPPR